MIPFITVLLILACIVLAFFVLIQNPKGGGLTGTFGTMSTQALGVKQSADVMEKGTWTMIGVIGGLCIISVMFLQKPQGSAEGGKKQQATQQQAPAKKK